LSDIGDLVLVHFNDQPAFFARVEDIRADVKPDWYQIRLLVLQVPPREVTWILRAEYIDGQTFTMSGNPVRIEALPGVGQFPALAPAPEPEAEQKATESPPHSSIGEKVVSLLDRLKPKDGGPDEVA
jgi:hypothetical protein